MEEIKVEDIMPDDSWCTCGRTGRKQLRECKVESCVLDRKHQEKVNDLSKRGWLPKERYRDI